MNRFENKLILVSGGTSGIGMAAALKLAVEGATLALVGRDPERLDQALKELKGTGHISIVADAADDGCVDAISKAGKAFGGYSGAVCCAGLHEVRPLSLLKSVNVMTSINANVMTAINCTKAVAKSASSEGGSVVWLSSVAAFRGTAGFAAYASAKGALVSAAKVAAVELAKKKIRVNVISAGVVQTPMSDGWLGLLSQEQRDEIAENHLLGIGQPADVADVIAFLLSNDARWITGTTLTVDGGLSAH